ncbi:outer membrane beta-barrel protein [Halomonas sp. CKK8]|uniref:outer membrane beta-barrel protein n=1 Tax=Halomonas sp. CKK8 TaxID=3036127 RepID=UPI002414F9FD|nr:outer membrane beta-barrel protein [Halomonas sp. CKK8]WFM69676.1 outer membrane beta-barrel protein [Halomonas sp. CKK8]
MHTRNRQPAFVLLPLVLAVSAASHTQAQDATGRTDWSHDVGVTVGNEYNDNIFYERENRVSDTITTVSPRAELVGKGQRHEIRAFGSAERGKYHEYQDENYTDWRLGGEGRYAYSEAGSLFGGVNLARGHEERSSPDAVNGEEPTLYDRLGTFAGINHRFGRITSRVGGTFETLDFEDVGALDGLTIENDDRDRDQATFGGRFGYRLDASLEPFFQVAADLRDYDQAVDIDGFDRDSEGGNAAVGLLFKPSPSLDLELLAGWLEQDYDDPALEDVGTWDLGGELSWRPAGSPTRVSARLDRSVEETTVRGASANLRTGVGAQMTTAIRPDLTLSTRASYSDHDYQGVARNDNLLGLGLGLRHYLNPHLFVGMDYDFLQRDSSLPAEDFDNNRLMVSLGTQLARGYEDAELLAAARDTDLLLDGYLGLQAGYGEIGTAQAGSRGSGGTLRADFRDAGGSLGLFGGPALTFGDWRLALELEAEEADAEWSHERSGGRVFSVEKQREYGAGLRIGHLLAGDNEVYARLGLVRGRFDLAFAEGGENDDQREWLDGRRLGGGLEVPLSTALGLRMDYSYTDYEDLDIGVGGESDDFAQEESRMRLGLAWHPGRQASKRPPTAPEAHDGLYLGGQVGYGSLITDLEGPRTEPSELEARFGDSGALAGLHVGYGQTFQRFYLGGELAAEVSDVTWNHERQPTGRTYSVDRESSLGLALRAGYVIDSGALLYLRGGPAWTAFETRYARGEQRVQLDETEQGWQFGGGIEVPLRERLRLRLDVSHSRYDDVEVDYGSGVDTLDSEENQMRLGMSVRF